MKKGIYFFSVILFCSCTSNTILKAPEDLIPKDTMQFLIQDMLIATSSKFFKNKKLQNNINYMPLVYDKFKIDSLRFKRSNLYYMSRIDEYKEIFEKAKKSLEDQKKFYEKINNRKDSLRRDSINKIKNPNLIKPNKDSIQKTIKENLENLDTIARPNF